jgi:hypothetical protein
MCDEGFAYGALSGQRVCHGACLICVVWRRKEGRGRGEVDKGLLNARKEPTRARQQSRLPSSRAMSLAPTFSNTPPSSCRVIGKRLRMDCLSCFDVEGPVA